MSCFFLKLGYLPCEYRADGMPDRAHLIPQQRLKAAGIDGFFELWNPALWVDACRRHHHLFDNKTIRLCLDGYPKTFQKWAKENGWFFSGERDGWLKEAA